MLTKRPHIQWLAILLSLCCTLCAYGKKDRQTTKDWDGEVMGQPVHVHLFTRKFSPTQVDKKRVDLHSTIGPNVIFGAFGGVEPSYTDYRELWFSITWKVNGKKITKTERTWILINSFSLDGDQDYNHDREEFHPSSSDDSLLVIVTCGDAVVERIAMRIPRTGAISRYVLETRS